MSYHPETPNPDDAPVTAPRFSFAKLALYALGAGVIVLGVSIPIIVAAAHWSPIAGLVVVLIAVVAVIATIGTVANRMVNSARADYLAAAERRQKRPNAQNPPNSPTDRNSDTNG